MPDRQRNLAGLVKPLVEGVIAALHPARGVDPVAISRVASAVGAPELEVARRLKASALPLLSRRLVVAPTKHFVRWDPEDELATRVSLVAAPIDCIQVWIL